MIGANARSLALRFTDLDDWALDDHQAALCVFVATCDLIRDPGWQVACAAAPGAMRTSDGARQFFETYFRPTAIGAQPALFTGYYEPDLVGSAARTPRFAWPIYRMPPELVPGQVWYGRAEIEDLGLLHGRGLELAWLDDPVEVFFLMVQGSGRVRLQDGNVMRVGYAGKNGRAYVSIGQKLVQRGVFSDADVSAGSVHDWIRANPRAGAALMRENPSYVFFREIKGLPDDVGPIGTMTRPLTPMRSVAVDPAVTPMGAPVWIEKDGARPIRQLMVAQDTGSAIRGPQRADIFFGTGWAAGEAAGLIKDSGRMVVLLPADPASSLCIEG